MRLVRVEIGHNWSAQVFQVTMGSNLAFLLCRWVTKQHADARVAWLNSWADAMQHLFVFRGNLKQLAEIG